MAKVHKPIQSSASAKGLFSHILWNITSVWQSFVVVWGGEWLKDIAGRVSSVSGIV